jgi:NAD-dependent deacetylase
VHQWLLNKKLITQNIDGLDGKAGNNNYIPIHGRLDKVTILHDQGEGVPLIDAPWECVAKSCRYDQGDDFLKAQLLDAFKISSQKLIPEPGYSLKPFVLLFDEFYTDLYRMNEAEYLIQTADKFVFMGTSFSVNITSIALNTALKRGCDIDIVDPAPIDLNVSSVNYYEMTAHEYILKEIN